MPAVKPSRIVLLVPLLAAFPASAENLEFDVSLFGLDVGEVRLELTKERIELTAETSGALLLFFPAKESIEIRLREGLPVEAWRRFDHAGRKGEWKATFKGKEVELEQRRGGDPVKRRTIKVPAQVYDPVSALQKLRASAPAKAFSLLLFGADGIYRFQARRASAHPLHYRGTFSPVVRVARPKRQAPEWLKALGLGRGGTSKAAFEVWLSDDDRRLPLRIRLSDPRGVVELKLKNVTGLAK